MKLFKELCKPSVFNCDETYVWLLDVEKSAVVRRKTVHHLLALVTGLHENNITLNTTPLGKHTLPDAAFDWNTSYSSHHLAFGLSFNSRIGIDIEDTTHPRAFDDIASEFFTSRERAQIHTPSDFYATWTAKESLMKAIGLGFNLEPKKFSIKITDSKIMVEEIDGYRKEDFHFETVLEESIRLCSCTFIPA